MFLQDFFDVALLDGLELFIDVIAAFEVDGIADAEIGEASRELHSSIDSDGWLLLFFVVVTS